MAEQGDSKQSDLNASDKDYKSSPAGMSAGGSVLGTPNIKAVNKKEKRQSLYAAQVKIHPRRVYGKFRLVKWVVMSFTLALYYMLPFLRYDRGHGVPDQAVFIDMPNLKAYMFGIEIWAQEIYYVTGLLILAAFVLFLMTSLAGRVWCGYTCPQTVWTDLFVHIERWVEGDRNQRIKLEKAPWSISKVTKRVIKHIVWIIVSFATGGAFVFYFGDAPTLAVQLVNGTAPLTSYLFMSLLAAFTYVLGGIAREQVCTYMCPWPRIQGALVDEHSLLITYDKQRGEKRGKLSKKEALGLGDCIDCKQCVAVCPMGIDIRDGFQMECIQCALCIDACNGIMEKIDLKKGLIRYAPTHVDEAGGHVHQKTKILRPRIFIYMGMIALVSAIMLATLLGRADFEINVLKDRNPIFVKLSSGAIRNGYQINLLNKQHNNRPVNITVEGLDGVQLKMPFTGPVDEVTAVMLPDDMLTVRLFVIVPKGAQERNKIFFVIQDAEGLVLAREEVPFNGPRR